MKSLSGRRELKLATIKPIISSLATNTTNTKNTNGDNLFSEYLPEIGKSLPTTIKTFKVRNVLSFSPDCLKQFLANCKGELKYLGFASCKDFSSAHLQAIIDYIENKKRDGNCGVGDEILKRLNVRGCYLINFEDLSYVKNFIKIVNGKPR
ncbi:6363_t:CDS:2 [Entrophospora sp. SA101]|nr:6363_t:CDS:2 [Entrophospora sp. SA101]